MTTLITQATASGNNTVAILSDRMELYSGWQGQNVEAVSLRDIASVSIHGWVNCTLSIKTNKGRAFNLERMALPDARAVKNAIESQKRKAGLYE